MIREKNKRISGNYFHILSLDGGGLKGIFTASFLASIENATGKRVIDHFDLITGTSTGGIIALALGLGFTPAQILEFYKAKGPIIFPSENICYRWLRSIKNIIRVKYSSEPLKKALDDYFGDSQLYESKVPLIIPSFDAFRGDVHIYKTPHHIKFKCDYKEPMSRIALATASAPTYLQACVTDVGLRLIDGGMWANNPAMLALTEALGYFEQERSDIFMLSIGTSRGPIFSDRSQWFGGLWPWRRRATEFMLHGQMISADNQVSHILGRERYLRINPSIGKKLELDEFVGELEGLGYSESRNWVNEIEQMFLGHTPRTYKPVYTMDSTKKEEMHSHGR